MPLDRDEVRALVLAVMALTERISRGQAARIDMTALGVLRIAAQRRGTRPTQIAAELRVHPALVTRRVQALEQEGKLVSKPDPADGRASLIEITPAGLADLGQRFEDGVDAFGDAIAGWTCGEVSNLAVGLGRLAAALDDREKRQRESAAGPRS
jgi:DNA-binding MarR family transcriptional regulator